MFCYLKRKAKANQEPPKSMADKLPGPITAVPFFLDAFEQVTLHSLKDRYTTEIKYLTQQKRRSFTLEADHHPLFRNNLNLA